MINGKIVSEKLIDLGIELSEKLWVIFDDEIITDLKFHEAGYAGINISSWYGINKRNKLEICLHFFPKELRTLKIEYGDNQSICLDYCDWDRAYAECVVDSGKVIKFEFSNKGKTGKVSWKKIFDFDYIKAATSKKAKTAGFNLETNAYYLDETHMFPNTCGHVGLIENHNRLPTRFSAPTQAVLQAWLMKVHKIFVLVDLDQTMEPKFCYSIKIFKTYNDGSWEWLNGLSQGRIYSDLYSSFEEAMEDGLIDGLNLVKLN